MGDALYRIGHSSCILGKGVILLVYENRRHDKAFDVFRWIIILCNHLLSYNDGMSKMKIKKRKQLKTNLADWRNNLIPSRARTNKLQIKIEREAYGRGLGYDQCWYLLYSSLEAHFNDYSDLTLQPDPVSGKP